MTPSHPLHCVLAATDFSAPSRDAAARAARVARASGASLTLLHAVGGSPLDELRHWLGLGSATEQALLDQARAELHAFAQPIAQGHGVAVAEQVAAGPVPDAIAAAADAVAADLIVAGARGAARLRRLALGSTTERVLRRTRRPLLVVHGAAQGAYRRVLVPVDFSPWTAPAIGLARALAPQARLVLLHAWSVPFEEKLRFAGVDDAAVEHYRRAAHAQAAQRLDQLAADHALDAGSWSACLVQGDAALRIVDVQREQDCDLVAIGKHGCSAVEDMLLGSVTLHVLAEVECDVLVVTLPQAG